MALGVQLPELTELDAAAPMLSRAGRQIVLQALAPRLFGMESGDMSSAFLRGSSGAVGSQNIFAKAPPEVAEMSRDPRGTTTRVKVRPAFCGLTEAFGLF